MSAKVGAGEEGGMAWLSRVESGCSCCACVGAVLHRLACCGDGLSGRVISTLSGGEGVRSFSVRGDRTSLFTMGVNRAVAGVAVSSSDRGDWNLPICCTGVDGGPSKVVSCGKEGANVA